MKNDGTHDARFYLKIGVLAVTVLLIIGYTIFEARRFIEGPTLAIDYPPPYGRVQEAFIVIKGSAHNISYLYLNDRKIFTDENGIFAEALLLPEGYSIIIVRAEDRFGRETKKSLELVYKKPPKQETASSTPLTN